MMGPPDQLPTIESDKLEKAFAAADELERERIARVRDEVLSLRREMLQALELAERALTKADAATEKRMESINEFRAELSDRTRTFVTRDLVDASLKSQSERMETGFKGISDRLDTALVGVDDRLKRIESMDAGIMGRQGGIKSSVGLLVTVISVVGVLIGIVVVLSNVIGQ